MNRPFRDKIAEEKNSIVFSPLTEINQYRCFNNNEFRILWKINVNFESGSRTSKNCRTLLVKNETHNNIYSDVLRKPSILLSAKKQEGKKILLVSEVTMEKNLIK